MKKAEEKKIIENTKDPMDQIARKIHCEQG